MTYGRTLVTVPVGHFPRFPTARISFIGNPSALYKVLERTSLALTRACSCPFAVLWALAILRLISNMTGWRCAGLLVARVPVDTGEHSVGHHEGKEVLRAEKAYRIRPTISCICLQPNHADDHFAIDVPGNTFKNAPHLTCQCHRIREPQSAPKSTVLANTCTPVTTHELNPCYKNPCRALKPSLLSPTLAARCIARTG
ncbi:hypothetical protein OE88DRAFT_238553 [Heliocybe sulcata]|uniref:Uncharacterized protein n=1 Tax=Heliocybe sulcata TaxID=5364 RepID=A0A5C3MZX3_9AGAM|nr:hypothetical protein OE88DRAFT_238553 [Heliocybe sulcata]